ncbi:MAG: BMP family ABC transporter substrate-binding protein [Oscillatoria sp. SIO1A7]|nr:BMP family ABC transporter substrate-binding protein [Oscillatoria sp. SIO1A7]
MLALLVCIPIACVGNNGDRLPATSPEAARDFRVAIVLPEAIDADPWSKAGYEGLKLIETELGAEVAYAEGIERKNPEEIKKIFRQYAFEGFDFIIGHGSEHLTLPALEVAAKEFPRSKFAAIGGGGSGNNHNLGVLEARYGELGYLAGVVAALKTKTNKIGYIGGFDYATLQEEAALLERGAKATKPAVEVAIRWLGGWTDAAKAETIARELMASGVDLFVLHGDPATQPLYPILAKAGIAIIGWNTDQKERSPDAVITSGVLKIPELLLVGATLVREGRWEGRKYRLGLREGVLELAPFRGALTPEEEALVQRAKDEILLGKIDVMP